MIYISGAITGTTDYAERFKAAEHHLSATNIVVNPARVNAELPIECNHDDYMAISIAMLNLCDTIYMLRGWENSEGAKEELSYAIEHGYRILLENTQ